MKHLPLIDVEDREQKVPDLSFPLSIKTTSSILSDAVDDVDIFAESVSFSAEPSKLSVQAEGDLSKAHIEIHKDDDTAIEHTGSEKITSKYSIEYLKKMVVGSKIANDVTISFNKDYPLKLEFKEVDKVLLSFILAPRVEND